jgi:hypothetical protein
MPDRLKFGLWSVVLLLIAAAVTYFVVAVLPRVD